MDIEKRKIRYRLPTRVVSYGGDIANIDSLLKEKDNQIYLTETDLLLVKGAGYIVLDFGEELCGGIRILTNIGPKMQPEMKIRIRLGESVSETYSEIVPNGTATNDHAMRDVIVGVPAFSDQSYLDSGFRFVRIDFLADSIVYHPIKAILAKEWYRDLKVIKHYQNKDELLNKIFDTAAKTVTLCIQNRIWDGIKRDRLVWIGDMEPEIHAILNLYGDIPEIEQTIKTAELSNPMPLWINGIPSYSAWYMLIIYDVYKYSQNKRFVLEHKDYLNQIINLFDKSLEPGNLDVTKAGLSMAMPYFIDWPTYREDNEKERKDAVTMLLQYIFPKVLEMYQEVGLETSLIKNIINKLDKCEIEVPTTKVFAAFYQLLHKDDISYQILIKDGAKDFSTFMSYYLLKAIAQKDKEKAKDLLKEYYGGMLSRGATSFWEDFNIEWLKGSSRIDELPNKNEKDLHGDFGGYCYKGFRHSLCHGWSAGPASYLLEEDK